MGETQATSEPAPSGCAFTPVRLAGIGLLVVAAIVAAIVLLGGDDDETGPGPDAAVPSSTSGDAGGTASTGASSASSSTSTAAPAAPSSTLPPTVEDALDELFGGAGALLAPGCRAVDSWTFPASDAAGAVGLPAPTLRCAAPVDLDPAAGGPAEVPAGSYVAVVVAWDEPPQYTIEMSRQIGVALDRPGFDDRVPEEVGGGLIRVPVDRVGFADDPAGWVEVETTDPIGGAADGGAPWYVHADPDDPNVTLLLPTEGLTEDTVVYLQVFGRRTEAGSTPSSSDPTVFHRIDIGPLGPCATGDGPCLVPAAPGRFTVQVDLGDRTEVADEVGDGAFRLSGDDLEVAVKVLDGCTFGEGFWVYAGGTTAATVTVTDTVAGRVVDLAVPGEPVFTPAMATWAPDDCG